MATSTTSLLKAVIKLPKTATYEGIELIDQGATSSVFKVKHRKDNKFCALKKVEIPMKPQL